jgi:hypothetical protein
MPCNTQTGAEHEIDALIEHCLSIREQCATPILVVDHDEPPTSSLDELAALVLASHLTHCFRLVVIADPDFDQRLAACPTLASVPPWSVRRTRELTDSEVAAYVSAWLNYSLAPGTAPIIFTPDSILLVAHRSQGIPAAINRIAAQMLMNAASKARRVLDSWDAWSAIDSANTAQIARPSLWPTSDVLSLLNRCRCAAGIAPLPQPAFK